jgi:regulatory protein SWI6
LEVNADPLIANRAGLKPVDFGIGASVMDNENGANGNIVAQNQSQKSRENSDDVLNCEHFG